MNLTNAPLLGLITTNSSVSLGRWNHQTTAANSHLGNQKIHQQETSKRSTIITLFYFEIEIASFLQLMFRSSSAQSLFAGLLQPVWMQSLYTVQARSLRDRSLGKCKAQSAGHETTGKARQMPKQSTLETGKVMSWESFLLWHTCWYVAERAGKVRARENRETESLVRGDAQGTSGTRKVMGWKKWTGEFLVFENKAFLSTWASFWPRLHRALPPVRLWVFMQCVCILARG